MYLDYFFKSFKVKTIENVSLLFQIETFILHTLNILRFIVIL